MGRAWYSRAERIPEEISMAIKQGWRGRFFEDFGDTIYSQSEVLEARESRSRPNVGSVTVKTTGYNQDRHRTTFRVGENYLPPDKYIQGVSRFPDPGKR
jgi:hypothetical protein